MYRFQCRKRPEIASGGCKSLLQHTICNHWISKTVPIWGPQGWQRPFPHVGEKSVMDHAWIGGPQCIKYPSPHLLTSIGPAKLTCNTFVKHWLYILGIVTFLMCQTYTLCRYTINHIHHKKMVCMWKVKCYVFFKYR